jgi:ABC-type nitrate/sulfonate/bicarbonate transport system ATPase subunit
VSQLPTSHTEAIERVNLYSAQRLARAKVTVHGLSKAFGGGPAAIHALEGIDLVLAPNDFQCIVGPSGCGKTTLLNILAGFDRPSSGEARLDGQLIDGPSAERGVVFQQGALFTWMTVRDNVAFGPLACGRTRREAREIAEHFIDLVGLSSFAGRFPYELSGGMQQRVGIARALANTPEVLLMDEPFAALDQQTRELLQEEIKRIWKRTGTTILWITHSIEEALFLATHVVVMTARPGRIKASFATHFDGEDHFVATSEPFLRARREVFQLLREESLMAQRQEGEIG